MAFWAPGGPVNPTTTPTTTTPPTTTTTSPGGGYGALATRYLNNMRDNVVFMWTRNNSFVNGDLTAYYQQQSSEAYVDGVYMIQNESGHFIDIFFAPYSANITGSGELTETQWNSMSGALIDNGIALMADATSHPIEPQYMPAFYIDIYFDDLTFFHLQYTSQDGLIQMINGTWTGGFTEYGWPDQDPLNYTEGDWVLEGGYLDYPLGIMYDTITETVSYPGT